MFARMALRGKARVAPVLLSFAIHLCEFRTRQLDAFVPLATSSKMISAH